MLLNQKLVFDSKALHPIKKSIAFHPFYGSQTAIRNYCGGQTAVGIVVSQPLTAASDLGLQAVVSHPLTSMKCVALL